MKPLRYEDDWKEYEKYNPDHYSRNLVKKNDRMELLVLCWEVKQGCPVHDHPANGCLVRIMQSEVTENVYKIDTPPELLNHNMLPSGGIAYKEGNMILHEIFNHSEHRAASIHIYSPSNYKPNYFSK
ncbi:MAG: cysteine dioxygenase [Bacteroidales bacterium]